MGLKAILVWAGMNAAKGTHTSRATHTAGTIDNVGPPLLALDWLQRLVVWPHLLSCHQVAAWQCIGPAPYFETSWLA